MGGTELTTITMASELKNRYACRCISVYEHAGDTPVEPCFEREYRWIYRRGRENNIRFVHDIIVREKIDMVIVQGGFERVRDYREAIGALKCKLVFAHHLRPGWELTFETFREIIRRRPKTILDLCRWGRDLAFYPIRRKNMLILFRACISRLMIMPMQWCCFQSIIWSYTKHSEHLLICISSG